MRNEPIEFILNRPRRNRRERASRLGADVPKLPASALDEAFAALPPSGSGTTRVDPPAPIDDQLHRQAKRPATLSNLATQVAALDVQCDRLAHLLQKVATAESPF
jgi:hypothetical protein